MSGISYPPWLGMSGITCVPLINVDLGRGIVVVSNNWEFKAFGPLGLPHVPRVHGIPGLFYL